ncbi:MAG: hypothetical protein WKG01_17860 [Kofleriaceae bacterium]
MTDLIARMTATLHAAFYGGEIPSDLLEAWTRHGPETWAASGDAAALLELATLTDHGAAIRGACACVRLVLQRLPAETRVDVQAALSAVEAWSGGELADDSVIEILFAAREAELRASSIELDLDDGDRSEPARLIRIGAGVARAAAAAIATTGVGEYDPEADQAPAIDLEACRQAAISAVEHSVFAQLAADGRDDDLVADRMHDRAEALAALAAAVRSVVPPPVVGDADLLAQLAKRLHGGHWFVEPDWRASRFPAGTLATAWATSTSPTALLSVYVYAGDVPGLVRAAVACAEAALASGAAEADARRTEIAEATQGWLRGELTATELDALVDADSVRDQAFWVERPAAYFARVVVECAARLADGRPGRMHDDIPALVECAAWLLSVPALPAELQQRHFCRIAAMESANLRLAALIRAQLPCPDLDQVIAARDDYQVAVSAALAEGVS